MTITKNKEYTYISKYKSVRDKDLKELDKINKQIKIHKNSLKELRNKKEQLMHKYKYMLNIEFPIKNDRKK